MYGLRQKLLAGFGGMLVILLVVSALGIAVLRMHRNQLDKFLAENWRSVEYGQAMLAALEQLTDLSRQMHEQHFVLPPAELDRIRTAAIPQLDTFSKNLALEDDNITLPGEHEIAEGLTILWTGKDLNNVARGGTGYHKAFLDLLTAASPADAAIAFDSLTQLTGPVKQQAHGVVDLNLANMTPVEGRIKEMADRASLLMIALSATGIALAVLYVAIVGRSILLPVQALTRSAREIEHGNLDLVVQVKSHDEIGQLAEAFNSMTAKLREYRRTNRAKLVRTQQTTQNAINSLPDAVAIIGPDGTVEMANTAAQKLFGLRVNTLVSDAKLDWLSRLWEATQKDHRPVEPRGYESAVQVLDESGNERFFLPRAVPVLDEDGSLMGVTAVLADVTHLRRLDELKSGMLSVVSHELKTPLTSIRMGVHLLLEERVGSLTPQQNDLLAAVSEDSDRLYQIVENLLDMSRIEAGRALFDLHPVAMQQVLTESTESMMPAFHDKGVELVVEPADELPAVLVDTTRIHHVFSNLLGNALKYTAPGGRVVVSSELPTPDAVRIRVTDTGVGIPADHLDRVFDRFFRVPGQSGSSGAGLGLAIAKDIVEAHGGQIRVESIEGEGSTFIFTLRVADQRVVGQHNITPAPTGANGQQAEEASHALASADR
jgi:PAS domain S-box-containing protein